MPSLWTLAILFVVYLIGARFPMIAQKIGVA